MADTPEKPPSPDGDKKPSGGKLAKILAAVFGGVIAPVLVTVLVKWGDPSLWKSQPTPPAQPVAALTTGTGTATTVAPTATTAAPTPAATVPAVPTTTAVAAVSSAAPAVTTRVPTVPKAVIKLVQVKSFDEKKGKDDFVEAVAISPDGKHILSGGVNRALRLWDVNGGPPLKVLRDPGMEIIRGIVFLPDSRRAIVGGGGVIKGGNESDGADFKLRMWDVETGKVVKTFEGHTAKVYGLGLSENGKTLVSAGNDKVVRVWDVDQGKEVHAFKGHKTGLWSLAISKNGRRILSGDDDGEVRVWDLLDRKGTSLPPHKFDVLGVAVSADGHWGLTGAVGKQLRLWNLRETKQVEEVTLPTGVGTVAFSPDGKRAAAASGWKHPKDGGVEPAGTDYRIRLYAVPSMTLLAESRDFPEPPTSLTFSSDGKHLACGGDTVHLLEIQEVAEKKGKKDKD